MLSHGQYIAEATMELQCGAMLKVVNTTLERGYCSLMESSRMVSPGVQYKADHGRRKLLHSCPLCQLGLVTKITQKSTKQLIM